MAAAEGCTSGVLCTARVQSNDWCGRGCAVAWAAILRSSSRLTWAALTERSAAAEAEASRPIISASSSAMARAIVRLEASRSASIPSRLATMERA